MPSHATSVGGMKALSVLSVAQINVEYFQGTSLVYHIRFLYTGLVGPKAMIAVEKQWSKGSSHGQ